MKVSPTTMFRSTAFIFGSRAVDAVVAIIFSIYVARMLGEDRYGLVAATMGVVGIMSLIGHMGLPNATTKWVSEYDAVGKHACKRTVIASTVILEFALGMVGAFLCYSLSDTLARDVFGKEELGILLRVGAPMILLGPFTNGIIAVFQGHHRMEYQMMTVTAGGVVRLVSTVLFLLMDNSVSNAIMGFVTGHFIAMFVSVTFLATKIVPNMKASPFSDFRTEMGNIISFGIPIIFMEAAVIMYEWTGALFLTALSDEVRHVSWFTIAFGTIALPLLISRSVGTAIFPIISNLHARKKRRTLRTAYEQAMKLTFVIMAPITMLLIAVAPYLIYVMYGEGFLPAAMPLAVLAGWGLLRPLATVAGATLAGVTRPKLNAYAAMTTLAINIPLLLILIPGTKPPGFEWIPVEGVMGAAWATTLSYITGMALQIKWASELVGSHLRIGRFAASLAAAIVSSVFVFSVLWYIGDPREQGTLMSVLIGLGTGLAGLVLYMIMVRTMGILDSSDVDLVKTLKVPARGFMLRTVRFLAGGEDR